MTTLSRAALVLALAVTPVALPTSRTLAQSTPTTTTTQSTGVPVRAVVLYSSGVGYFEHFGIVHGADKQTLPFKKDQINDVLKSLVLQDLDGGQVSVVTYPSQDPLDKTLKSFQVDIAGNPPLAQLFTQLRGAKVTLETGGTKLSGTVLGVEQKQKAAGSAGGSPPAIITTPVLSLLTHNTIRALEMDSITSIQLDDPELQDELTKALTAVAAARDQDKKPVTIGFSGNGDRRVRVGYVIETPVWKTSYRLLLEPADKPQASFPSPGTPGEGRGEGSAHPATAPKGVSATQPSTADGKLQGWAIVENQTDSDWNNVQLSLVSGRPISFVQDLYQPLYVPRPVVQNELFASLRPQLYGDALSVSEAQKALPQGRARQQLQQLRRLESASGGLAGAPAAGAAVAGAAVAPAAPAEESLALRDSYFSAGQANFAKSIASAASANAVGELFQYTVPNVTLARQRSAMLPIVTDDIEVERLSIYNQSVLAKNPLNGARLKNTTGKHLLTGPITVLEGSTYAEDARIDNLPPGQERLISYGVDLQLRVNAENNTTESAIRSGKIVKGVLEVINKHVASQDYVMENRADYDKTVVVEHPLKKDWDLVDSPKPTEKTETLYRFREPVAAHKSAKLTVKEEHTDSQAIAILPADLGQLDFYAKRGEISKDVRDALSKAADLKRALVDAQRDIDTTTERIKKITDEQSRIRQNMNTVQQNTPYYTRLLNKLNDQETQLEKLQLDLDDHHKTMESRREELETYLSNLNVG